MATSEQLQEDINVKLRDMDAILEEFFHYLVSQRTSSNVMQKLEQVPIRRAMQDVQQMVASLLNASVTQTNPAQPGLQAITAVGGLGAQIQYLGAQLAQLANAQLMPLSVLQQWQTTQSYLQPIMQAISMDLWQLVSQLLTVQEWSMNGDMGVSLFGLPGTAGITLTFR